MTNLLAIDPGNVESGWVVIDTTGRRPLWFGKTRNAELQTVIQRNIHEWRPALVAIEMIASYGMAVGADVFETAVWIGRFEELTMRSLGTPTIRVKRHPVKMHHCHNGSAKDSNIRQALVDRFAMGQPNYGKGTKANPGWFYGFKADIWQAYALAVYAADLRDPLDADEVAS